MLGASRAISAKAKAMYGQRLRPAQYEELVRKKSVAEIAQVLKNDTAYHDTLRDIREVSIHRGQLEHLLKQNLYERLDKLVRYVDGKSKTYFLAALKEIEIEQIMMRIRLILSRDFTHAVSDVPLSLRRYSKLNTEALIDATSFEQLLAGLAGSPYAAILAPFITAHVDPFPYTECESAIQRYYMEHVMDAINQTFSGKTEATLKQMWATRVELDNITKIYRYKKFFHGDEKEIKNALIPCAGCIPRSKLNELLTASSVEQLLQMLADSPYHLHMDDREYVYIEYYADQIKYHLAKRHMYYDQSPAIVYSAYQLLGEREIENLINIIEGVRYRVAPEEIMTMLIYDREE